MRGTSHSLEDSKIEEQTWFDIEVKDLWLCSESIDLTTVCTNVAISHCFKWNVLKGIGITRTEKKNLRPSYEEFFSPKFYFQAKLARRLEGSAEWHFFFPTSSSEVKNEEPSSTFLVSTIHMVVRAKSCVFAFFVFDFCIFLYFREIGRHSCRQWKLQKIIDQSYRWICFFDESHSYGINFTCTSKIRLFIEYYRYFRRISRVLKEYLSRFCNYGLMSLYKSSYDVWQLWSYVLSCLCLSL